MKQILLTTIAAVVLVGCGLSMSIHDAAAVGDTKAVKQHIAAGTDVDAKDTNDALGMTPLHYAVANGHKEVIELLLVTAGVNVKTGNGLTPLDLAVSKGDKEIIAILRKHGGKTGEELKAEGK
jgi:ankyrin repeat protein